MVGDKFSFQYRRYYTYLQPIIADPVIRSYFSLIASFFLIAFLVFFALSPTINTILGLQKQINDQKEILSTLEKKNADLLTASENYNQVLNQIPYLDEALPKVPAPAKIISDVNTTASASGVAVTGLTFTPIQLTTTTAPQVDPVSGFSTLDFNFSVKGSMQNIHTFLSKIENKLHYIRLKNLTIPANGAIIDVTAINYYLP